MKKKIISCFIICVVITMSYFYAHIDKNYYIYNRNVDASLLMGTGSMLDGETVTQSFVSEENAIDGINIKIEVYGTSDNLVLQYKVLDGKGSVVSKAEISGAKLQHNKFNHLQLPIIRNTQGNQYTLVLDVKGADAQNGLGFFVEPGTKENQELVVKQQETEGTLVTRITSHRFDLETFVVLLGIIIFIVGFMRVLYRFFG